MKKFFAVLLVVFFVAQGVALAQPMQADYPADTDNYMVDETVVEDTYDPMDDTVEEDVVEIEEYPAASNQ